MSGTVGAWGCGWRTRIQVLWVCLSNGRGGHTSLMSTVGHEDQLTWQAKVCTESPGGGGTEPARPRS